MLDGGKDSIYYHYIDNEGETKMSYYMNITTGTVQSAEDWIADGFDPATTQGLEEVVRENGEWVEA